MYSCWREVGQGGRYWYDSARRSAKFAKESKNISDSNQIVLVVGSNRTGTSLLTEILLEKGFSVPGETAEYIDYDTHESKTFKKLSRHWDADEARQFVAAIPPGKFVLKYPKASRKIERWLDVMPDARVIYVFRPRRQAIESNLKYSWGSKPLAFIGRWLYRREWNRGLLALADISAPIAFVTFEELKLTRDFQFPESFGWS